MLEKKGVFCVCQVCLKKFVFYLHVSGTLKKKCFLHVSGMFEKKCVFFCLRQVCLKRNGVFACVRYV